MQLATVAVFGDSRSMANDMTEREAMIYRRPPFDPKGRLRVRGQTLKFGIKGKMIEFAPGAMLPPAKVLGLSERDVWVMWEQYKIDTLPSTRVTGSTMRERADTP